MSSLDLEDEELEPLLCPFCQKVGLNVHLGPLIIMPGQVKQPDYDQFLQCARCAEIIPIYQTEPEPTIQDSVATIENPFDESKGQVLAVSKDSKTQKRTRNKLKPSSDNELNELIRIHGDNLKIIQGE